MGLFDWITGSDGGYQAPNYNSVAQGIANRNLQDANSSDLQAAAAKYGLGDMSLADLMKAYGGSAGGAMGIVQNPFSGSKMATEQVQNNDLLRGSFGQGGSLSQALGQEHQLATEGFTLHPEDYTAYGQASDNIARMFGQNGNNLAQALASRGLAGAGGGVVGAQFAGLQGNQNEQLAQAQMSIAQNRMNMNRQLLNDTRNYIANMTGQAESSLNSQYNRNMSGVNSNMNALNSQQANDTSAYNAQSNAMNNAWQAQQAGRTPGLMDAVGSGIQAGVRGGVQKSVGGGINSGISGLFGSGG